MATSAVRWHHPVSGERAPAISVILPAFNAETYLREAVDSILSQTFTNFELVIVDDGSTDGTRELVLSYADPRIRLIANTRNLGLTRSLNHALSVARGEYIARQDADDVSEPQRLEVQAAHLARHASVALVGAWFTVIDEHGAEVRRTRLPVDDLDLRWAMFFSCPFVHSAVMWRRAEVERSVGRYDERLSYAQDYEFWTRIAARFAVANVGAFLVRYREHQQSMTSTYGERTMEGHCLSVGAVAQALAWRGSGQEHDGRFRRLAALLRRSQAIDLTPEQARRSVRDLLALQASMCERWRVEPRVARRHRRGVRAAISRGLVRLSARSADQGRTADARGLLRAAYAAYWPALADRTAAGLAARLIRGRPAWMAP